jgi:hypothetical protein
MRVPRPIERAAAAFERLARVRRGARAARTRRRRREPREPIFVVVVVSEGAERRPRLSVFRRASGIVVRGPLRRGRRLGVLRDVPARVRRRRRADLGLRLGREFRLQQTAHRVVPGLV